MRNRAFLKVALLGLLAFAFAPGYAAAGQDLSEMLASSAAVQATAVSGPILQVAPLSHDYGVQDNGTSTGFNFTVSNIGDQDLHISSVTSSDPAFVAGVGSPIGPGGSMVMVVSFNPTDGAFHSGSIMVSSDGGMVTVGVQGQANAAPSIASPGDQVVAAFTTLSFTVTATDADDTLDDALTYSMTSNLPPGPTFNTSTGEFSWSPVDTDAGTYAATFSASDGRLTSTTPEISITVTAGNRPPVANAGGSYAGATNSPVTLDGSGSSDPDAGQTLSYHWVLGDGNSANGAVVSHVYTAPNTYIATLTVTDDGTPQLSASDFASVVIQNEIVVSLILKNNGSTIRTHGGGKEKIGIEETQQALTSIVVGSLKMTTTYPNAGTVSSISAQTKGATIGDMDLDGISDLGVYFLRSDIGALLGNVPNNTAVTIQITGQMQLSNGLVPIRGTKVITVKSSGNAVDVAAYPNPFNPQTTVSFTTRQSGAVTMHVYSIDGRLVKTLKQAEYTDAGTHEVTWNGLDNLGRRVPSGVYFVKTSVGGDTSVFKLSIMK
jgi:PKD domain-containing protein/putative Ig domain-containing protein/flagellar hook capping protein FlgD/HYDIN/CFA65/VesB family protein